MRAILLRGFLASQQFTRRSFRSMVSSADLAPDHDLASQRHHIFRMAHMLFTCPTTSMKVQHGLDEGEDAPENQYEGITCPACNRLRFLNRRTGELLVMMKNR